MTFERVLVGFLALCGVSLATAQSCPTSTIAITDNLSTQNYLVNGNSYWSDPLAYASDGEYMSQAVFYGNTQTMIVYNLNPGSTQVNSQSFPQTYPRLALVASATVNSDSTIKAHVYWNGVTYDGASYPVSSRVDVLKVVQPPMSGPQWTYQTVSSGQRIVEGGAATCGSTGYTRDLSVRAFGWTYGTDASPSNKANATVFDYYYVGNSFGSENIPSSQTRRGQVTSASAGTLCMWGGGVTITGEYVKEVSVLNVSTGTSTMSWSKWNLSLARTKMASAFISAPGGGKVFFAGGQQFDGQAVSVVDVYNLNTKTLTTTCLPKGGRFQMSATVIDNKFVIFAGGFTDASYHVTNAIDIYDSANNVWYNYAMSEARSQIALGSYPTSSGDEGEILLLAAGGVTESAASTKIDRFVTLY